MSNKKVIYCEDTKEKVYGYKEYLKTEHWKIKRRRIAKQRNFTCEICGAKREDEKMFNVHHSTYERLGHELNADLHFLCATCHDTIHKEERFELLKSRETPEPGSKKKNKSKKTRKYCKTCEHFLYSYNEKTRKYGYCCEISGEFAKSYNQLKDCKSPNYKKKTSIHAV